MPEKILKKKKKNCTDTRNLKNIKSYFVSAFG